MRLPFLHRRRRPLDPRHRRTQYVESSAAFDRLGRKNLPERPSAAPAGEKPVQVAREVVQALAALKARRDDGHEGVESRENVGDRRRLAELF